MPEKKNTGQVLCFSQVVHAAKIAKKPWMRQAAVSPTTAGINADEEQKALSSEEGQLMSSVEASKRTNAMPQDTHASCIGPVLGLPKTSVMRLQCTAQ